MRLDGKRDGRLGKFIRAARREREPRAPGPGYSMNHAGDQCVKYLLSVVTRGEARFALRANQRPPCLRCDPGPG